MIEKVVKCINELDQPHLKLMVMHDLRNRPPTGPTHTERGTGILDEISELWTLKSMISPRALLTGPSDPADQQCVNMPRTRP